MIDYNNSENASSLIGMLKQGGGIVNIEDEQTITGLKSFANFRVQSPTIASRNVEISVHTFTSVPSTGWLRVAEYSNFDFNCLFAISTIWAVLRHTSSLLSIIDNSEDISYNKLNNNKALMYITGVRIKTDHSTTNPQPRYICLNVQDSYADEKGIVTLSVINFSHYAKVTWYDTPVIDTDIEGYTNYDLDLVSST